MFDFQRSGAYQKAKVFNLGIASFIRNKNLTLVTEEKLSSSAYNIMLNIAGSFARLSNSERLNSLVNSMVSVNECIALLDYLKDTGEMDEFTYLDYARKLEEISRLLKSDIKKFSN
jgi:four helix bundle protein